MADEKIVGYRPCPFCKNGRNHLPATLKVARDKQKEAITALAVYSDRHGVVLIGSKWRRTADQFFLPSGAANIAPKKAAIEAGLRLLILDRQTGIRRLRGKLAWDGNLEESRFARNTDQ
jgi:hypothetical protein